MTKFQIKYPKSKACLIAALFLFLPVGITLLLMNGSLVSGERTIKLSYNGSRFWLLFWSFFCFPVTILLMIFNGTFVSTLTFKPKTT
jgi:hypothetical protein